SVGSGQAGPRARAHAVSPAGVRLRRILIRRGDTSRARHAEQETADRDRPDPDPGDRRLARSRTGRRRRDLTCFDMLELRAAVSSAPRSLVPPPLSGQRPWSPTVSTGATTAETTDETTEVTDETIGATAAEPAAGPGQGRSRWYCSRILS